VARAFLSYYQNNVIILLLSSEETSSSDSETTVNIKTHIFPIDIPWLLIKVIVFTHERLPTLALFCAVILSEILCNQK